MTGTTLPRTTLPRTALDDRALLRLSGDDPRGFLQGLVTVDTAGALPRWTALLTPQGKVLFDFILWADGDDVLIDCERTAAEALAKRLSIYRLRRAITIAPDATLAIHWAHDAAPADAATDPRLPALGYRWLTRPDGETPFGGPADPTTAWHAHRLSLGVTEGVAELGSDKTLWLECNAAELNGVDFAKGCYVGQENTARMHYRSKVNRRLVVAPLAEPGDRTRACYPDLALMVEHRRVDALGDAIVPDWFMAAN